jgi:hypothetical protein
MPGVLHVDQATATFEASVRMARLAALGDGDGLLHALSQAEADLGADELAAALRRHQLGPLLRRTLADPVGHRAAPAGVDAVMQLLRSTRVSQRELLEAYVALAADLARAGLPVVLLKGAVLAQQLYGDIESRMQYDIDVLVAGRDTRRARRVLQAAGFRKRRRDSHSISFVRGAVHLDLHHALRSSPAYAINEARLWSGARSVTVAGHDVRTLSDADTLAFLAMSLVEDVGFGMQKLKNLCDIWLLSRLVDQTIAWDDWFSVRSEEHIEAVVANGCALALGIFGSPSDAPHLRRALHERRDLLRLKDRAQSVALVTAARGAPANMAWFSEVYPGSMLQFRLHSFVSGWPETRHELRPGRIAFEVNVLRARRAERAVDGGP